MAAIREWLARVGQAWDRFWFTPAEPHTLGLIRILAGAMLLYTHLVWSKELLDFLGEDAWITSEVSQMLGPYRWSYLWYVSSPWLLWTLHALALLVFTLFTVGFCSRWMSILAWFITISYCHRLTGSLFGLDQVNVMLAMYLMVGPSGAAYSVDRLLARRRSAEEAPRASIGANIAVRLIQLHLCVIYLFGGLAKMRGAFWWDGTALWMAIANLEYQSLDVTWLGQWPLLMATLAHITVFWETFYCALIWPRLTRPIVLGLALLVHGGIAVALGMITFGLAMIIANLAFVSPETVRSALDRLTARVGRRAPEPRPARAGQGGSRPPASVRRR